MISMIGGSGINIKLCCEQKKEQGKQQDIDKLMQSFAEGNNTLAAVWL